MTDEEILKRVAEIEGVSALGIDPDGQICDVGNPTARLVYEDPVGGYTWDPLENWSDLGPLIEKYKVEISWDEVNGRWSCWIDKGEGASMHKSLPHAICLAIIEAYGD